MTLDRDDDGMPLHDSEEDRAMSAARRLALRDAAPDLLAALIEMVRFVGTDGHALSMIPEDTWNFARRTIAKATGS